MKEIGQCKIKRPKFIIFTDKDGTLNFEDKQLNHIFCLISNMGGLVIPITGRTIGDIRSDFVQRKIKVPEIIIGDNGANIYHEKSGRFVLQKVLEHEKVLAIVNYFIANGGNVEFIRYTNGGDIFASKDKEVKDYYKKSKAIKLYRDIYGGLQKTQDITKLTLAGSQEMMQKTSKFARELDFWTDMDVTKFPKGNYHNYRLDVAQKDINKGEAVKWITARLEPEYGYMCVGNGFNDMSMFQVAIDDGMRVGVMKNSPIGLIEEVRQYARDKNKGKVSEVPFGRDLANKYILKMAKCFQTYMKTQERKSKISKRLPHVKRIKVNGIQSTKRSNDDMSRRINKDR